MSNTSDRAARRASQHLRASMAAVRVSFTWLGVRKTLTPDQRAQAAEPFGAQEQYLSAAKKLLDTSAPQFRAVTGIRSRIVSYWKGMTLPYPEPGLRLIRQDQVAPFNTTITALRDELVDAVDALDGHYDELQACARERLGALYNPADYPATLKGLFLVEWEFPTVEPPDYLMRLNPEIYQQECRRVSARFDQAVQMAQEAFTAEFAKLVSHLTERLSGQEGQKKVFRDSAVVGLKEFFERFKALNVHSSGELDELVAVAQKAVDGVGAQDLRDSAALREQVSGALSKVSATLESLLVNQPRRKIVRVPERQVA